MQGQAGGSVAQVTVATGLGHLVDGGVGAGWEVHVSCLVTVSLFQAALHLQLNEAG